MSDEVKLLPCSLGRCPVGLFMFNDTLCFKSEYKTKSQSRPGFWQTDAYVVESGEYFWGGTPDPTKREKLIVTPIEWNTRAPAPREDGWRPIETAPKDGHRILVGGNSDIGWWHCIAAFYHGKWHHDFPSTRELNSEPTHWRPLPSPPTDQRPIPKPGELR